MIQESSIRDSPTADTRIHRQDAHPVKKREPPDPCQQGKLRVRDLRPTQSENSPSFNGDVIDKLQFQKQMLSDELTPTLIALIQAKLQF